jgi:hypothetical protein
LEDDLDMFWSPSSSRELLLELLDGSSLIPAMYFCSFRWPSSASSEASAKERLIEVVVEFEDWVWNEARDGRREAHVVSLSLSD